MDVCTSAPERSQLRSQSLKEILARFGGIAAGSNNCAQTEEEVEEGEPQLPWAGNQSTSPDSDIFQATFLDAADSRGEMRLGEGSNLSASRGSNAFQAGRSDFTFTNATGFGGEAQLPWGGGNESTSPGNDLSKAAGSRGETRLGGDSNLSASRGINSNLFQAGRSDITFTNAMGFGGDSNQAPSWGSRDSLEAIGSSDISHAGYEDSRGHRWKSQVVWCHGHCFKPENAENRNALKRVANMHRADLACIRRPDKLIYHCRSEFWQSATLEFWVGVTPWREAKPFFDLCKMSSVAPMMPRFMVVLCVGESQYRKAVRWVADLRPPLPIYCLREADDSLGGRLPHQIPSHFAEISELLGTAEQELPLPSEFHAQKPRTVMIF